MDGWVNCTRGSAGARLVIVAMSAFLLAGCEGLPDADPASESAPAEARAQADGGREELPPEQHAFWTALLQHCGQAYAGSVSDATPYYADGLEGAELSMHVRTCEEDRIHISFHVDENHSRNWILTQAGGTIRLKHDHRSPDGTEDEISQYGGDAPSPGLPSRQIFPADVHTTDILPDRSDNFWFFDFVDEETLQYGVHWPKFGHSIRVEFDLSTPIETPPDPWGYEGG